MNKTERIIIEVVHEDGKMLDFDYRIEGDLAFDKTDYADRMTHVTAIMATMLGESIVTMTADVADASFAAGQFFELVLRQIKDAFEGDEDE